MAGASIVKHQSGSDPAAVAFDAIESARHKKIDAVIIDTAGRLHTKSPLMEELKKVKRVVQKAMPLAPQEVLLVVDATTGQNALRQAQMFNEAIGITGVALTKLDGTAKGGIVFAIKKELGIPVRLIGVGEGVDDLRDFDPKEFVEALFDIKWAAFAAHCYIKTTSSSSAFSCHNRGSSWPFCSPFYVLILMAVETGKI